MFANKDINVFPRCFLTFDSKIGIISFVNVVHGYTALIDP